MSAYLLILLTTPLLPLVVALPFLAVFPPLPVSSLGFIRGRGLVSRRLVALGGVGVVVNYFYCVFLVELSKFSLWLCPPRKSKNGIEHSLINLSEKDFLVLLSQREGRVPGSTPRPHPVLDVIPRHFAFETLHAHVFIFSAQLTSLVPYFLLSLSICNWERLPFLQQNDRERTLQRQRKFARWCGQKPYLLKEDRFADP
jgi:hypothetical protein